MILESYKDQISLLWKVGGVITTAETACIVYLFKKLMDCQSQIQKRAKKRSYVENP